jgi:hypothetical protein
VGAGISGQLTRLPNLVTGLDESTPSGEDRQAVLRYWLVLAALLATIVIGATAAEARVTLLRLTSPVSAGS